MKAEDSIFWIKNHLKNNRNYMGVAEQEVFEMAIDVLNKQIPKKPIKKNGYSVYTCPTCEELYSRRVVMSWEKYCPDCGQALDWSVKNNDN